MKYFCNFVFFVLQSKTNGTLKASNTRKHIHTPYPYEGGIELWHVYLALITGLLISVLVPRLITRLISPVSYISPQSTIGKSQRGKIPNEAVSVALLCSSLANEGLFQNFKQLLFFLENGTKLWLLCLLSKGIRNVGWQWGWIFVVEFLVHQQQ